LPSKAKTNSKSPPVKILSRPPSAYQGVVAVFALEKVGARPAHELVGGALAHELVSRSETEEGVLAFVVADLQHRQRHPAARIRIKVSSATTVTNLLIVSSSLLRPASTTVRDTYMFRVLLAEKASMHHPFA
jgi:hypothetical protein